MLEKLTVDPKAFNAEANLPYELRTKDFELAMQDVYDFNCYSIKGHHDELKEDHIDPYWLNQHSVQRL